MAIPFEVDVEDLEFVLLDELRAPERLAAIEAFADLDRDVWRATLGEGSRIAREVLHPINAPADREGCRLDDDGNVTTPRGFREAWSQLAAGGWIAPAAPAELGGGGMPTALSMALHEMFVGANTAFMMVPGLTASAARMVRRFAPEAMREPVARKLIVGEWAGTMCLTEAGAGSAVGHNRCKATPTGEPGVYHLEGEKIFITGGDQDLTENIVHLVLARTPDSPGGTKGLSLFLVPKWRFDQDLALGARNGAKVVGLEHKLGIHGSATCTLALGADAPCVGWLMGGEREGIALMFQMMNEARLGVAAQGVAMATAAYGYARQYAHDRVQGTAIGARGDADASRVAIVEHPDVRRMLMTQKVIAETMRSALLRNAVDLDVMERDPDESARDRARDRVELLTPVLKAHLTDLGFDMAVLGVQILGGYGYISEFPLEQLVRDAKIQSIYEGTNGIQALDLVGRKLRMKNGRLLATWLDDARTLVADAEAEGFTTQARSLADAIVQIAASAKHLAAVAERDGIEPAVLHATAFLRQLGTVLLGLEAQRQARTAKRILDAEGESPRLHAKLHALDFYVSQLLPQADALARAIQSNDASPLAPDLFTR